jgi:hypothetical protein
MWRSKDTVSARRTAIAFAVSAVATTLVTRLPSPDVAGWVRPNYRGRPVSLSGGAATASGLLLGALSSGPLRRSAFVATASAAIAGAFDDLLAPRIEQGSDKGLAGHVRALRSGRVSGGVVKVAVIGTGSLIAAARLPAAGTRGRVSGLVDAGLIAGSANLLNLFDLRPGRAAKVALIGCAAIAAGGGFVPPLAAVAAASAATLPGDLSERTVLGDLGANSLGAMIGVTLAAARPRVRLTGLIAVAALTLASERVSFSRVISDVAALRWLDELGRVRPTEAIASGRPAR